MPRRSGGTAGGPKRKRSRADEDHVEALDLTIDRPKGWDQENDESAGDEEEALVHNKSRARGKMAVGVVLPSDAHKGAEVDDDEMGVEAEEEGLARAANAALRQNIAEDDYAIPGVSISLVSDGKAKSSKREGGLPTDAAQVIERVARDFKELSEQEQLRMLQQQSPELLKLLEDFKKGLSEVQAMVPTIANLRQLLTGERLSKAKTSETATVLQLLETKLQLMLSYCVHINFYLVLKAEGKKVEGHPVVDRLIELRVYLEKLWPLEQKAQYALNKLLNARDGQSSGAKVASLRAVAEDATGVYRPLKSVALDSAAARRKAEEERALQEQVEKEEESLMTRGRATASKKTKRQPGAVDEAVEMPKEPEDHFFTRIVHGDSSDEAEDDGATGRGAHSMSLVERLKARVDRAEAAAKAVKANVKGAKAAARAAASGVESDEEQQDVPFSEADEAEYQRLLAEEQEEGPEAEEEESAAEAAAEAAEGAPNEEGPARRGVSQKIQKNRGLTKSRRKDRKTPHTNRKAKVRKGDAKHKAQTRQYKPMAAAEFSGVPGLKAHITHSRSMV